MNAGILDTIVNSFVGALQSGTTALQGFSLPLLAVFALFHFYLTIGPMSMSPGSMGDVLAMTLLTVLKIGFFYFLLVHLSPLAIAAFLTFLEWGATPSRGAFSADAFLHPSTFLDLGFRAALPIQQFIQSFSGMSALWNMFTILTYMVAYWIIVLSFLLAALHLMIVVIEFHAAVMAGTVLIPFAVFGHTAFLGEFAFGWLTGSLVRTFLTVSTMAIAVPLFELLGVATTAGGDPTLYSSLVMAMASGVFAVLAWIIPGKAATIAGRGMALGLHGGTLLAGASSSMRGVLMVTTAVRGVSAMMGGRR